jgi:predicted small lipoprotein YifL
MEPKNVTKWMMVAFLAIALTACGKKKNGSSDTAAPPAPTTPTVTETCTYNQAAQAWLNQNNQSCTPTNNTITCTWNAQQNKWLNQQGQTCTPTNGAGPCDYWTNYYHVYYVPIQVPVSTTFPQGLACFNINYLNGWVYNTHYYDNYDYWNYTPPHTCNSNNSSCGGNQSTCNTRISFGGSIPLWDQQFGFGTSLCLK